MESRNPLRHIVAIIITLIPVIYLAIIWKEMPAEVAVHFDKYGKPDAFGSRLQTLLMTAFMSIVAIGTYVLVVNAHRFDKRRKLVPGQFDNIAMLTVVFVTVLNLTTVFNSLNPDVVLLDKIIVPAIGLFFIFMGNIMYNIKPNKFVGIRVPWTLNDDDNWKMTHRMGSKLFFVGGLLITLVALGFPVDVASMFLTAVALLIAITTTLYSYLYHRKTRNNNA